MDSDHFLDLATEHILHGLSGAEREEFEAELGRRGEAGERQLDRLRETWAALALAAPPEAPPVELGARLRAMIDAEGRGRRPETGGPERSRAATGWMAAAAIAAGIGLAMGIWNLLLRRELSGVEAALRSAENRLAVADSVRDALASLQGDLMTITSPEATALTLQGTDAEPTARARAFLDPVTGRALLFVYELPLLPPDSVYQLWAIRGQTPAGAGTFRVGADRRGRLEVDDAGLVLGADVLAVTVEPSPGQPAPTGPIVLSSAL